LRANGRKALIPFITAGDPSLEATVPVMHALVRAGADVIELGVPFSDPMADGPTIQRSSERALGRGAGLAYVLEAVHEFRREDAATPVVLMGYLNPIEIHG
ncbi:tryptophan synthase subunit alpha, partial [Xanthomonas oryzae pv. oryzae]